MPAYNFRSRFAHLVEIGAKRTTIRPPRKRQTGAGDMIYCYTGMRTKTCRLLGTHWIRAVTPILITYTERAGVHIELDGRVLDFPDIGQLAIEDGFLYDLDLCTFLSETYGDPPWNMRLIAWDYLMVTTCDLGLVPILPYKPRDLVSLNKPAGSLCRVIKVSQDETLVCVEFADDGRMRWISSESLEPVYAPDRKWPNS